MSEILQAVTIDGLPAIRISEQRGDPYKGRTKEHIEYHVMSPADAEWLGRELIRLSRGEINTPKISQRFHTAKKTGSESHIW